MQIGSEEGQEESVNQKSNGFIKIHPLVTISCFHTRGNVSAGKDLAQHRDLSTNNLPFENIRKHHVFRSC